MEQRVPYKSVGDCDYGHELSPPTSSSSPLLMMLAGSHHRLGGTHLIGMPIDDSGYEMQGVLCLPPGQLDHDISTKLDEMEVTAEPLSKEMPNQSDSGIFSTTANSTTFPCSADENRTHSEDEHSDNRSDCSTPDRKYVCPICNNCTLNSQHDFTLHLRSHKNDADAPQDPEKGYTCRICGKVLCSSSSLDRHVLVHTGERPFTCKHCGDTFTTNGNMHRHVRTHKIDANYESDGSVDSTASSCSKSIEYNNNQVEKNDNKRKLEDVDEDETYHHVGKRPHLDADAEGIKCPVCSRDDFTTRRSLEVHVEDNHPDYPAKCHECNQLFNNQKRLNYHKMTVHADDSNGKSKNVVVGFKHIDYVDFSSDKFPTIARHECEMVFHKAPSAGPKFVCGKCQRAFPCDKSLEIHTQECGTSEQRTMDIRRVAENIKREEFFHRLDLEDNTLEKQQLALRTIPNLMLPHNLAKSMPKLEESLKLDGSKDLADIQSIISLTNGSFLQQLHGKTQEIAQLEQEKMEEEESQDLFAQEFRKMKLRGEFPCRLCSSVFPNLRALKGHNRTHLNSVRNGSYRCNMCPHSSLDKAALIRHMRTHNGDRPYECSLCNYAFTTKANCERHLRNRHSKSTREEVKKSIIYHPSEDPTNEEITKSLETKKLNPTGNIDSPDLSMTPARSSTPKSIPPAFPDVQLNKDFSALFPIATKMPNVNELILNENLKSLAENQQRESNWPQFATSTPNKPVPNIRVKDVSALKEIPEQETSFSDTDESVPMDLSKKKSESDQGKDSSEEFSKPEIPQFGMTDFLTQQLLKTSPPADPALFFAAQLAFYRNSLPNVFPGFPINPLMMPPMMPEPMNQEAKERLRQFSSGALKNLYAPNNFPLFSDVKMETVASKPEEMKPLTLNVDTYNENSQMKASPILPPKPELHSPNSVKMVIKNGVLMPKQKQRRYRTERPFSCEHCAARFTLRSNMERHIKQQHPQFWSQRQRSSLGNPGRKPLMQTSPPKNLVCDLNIPTYEAPKVKNDEGDAEENKSIVSEKLRYAILSQHLRAAQESPQVKKEDFEEEDALVIDEPEELPKPEPVREIPKSRILEEKLKELRDRQLFREMSQEENVKKPEEVPDLVPVARLLNNAAQPLNEFREYFQADQEEHDHEAGSEEDEEGLVASGSTSEGNSGTDENRSENDNVANPPEKKKSAYSLAPNRVSCPYCSRKFPWTSSLRRHILTHTGQKPFKCSHCPLLFTTKSNCDRHLLRKHGNSATTISNENANSFMMRNVPERPFKCSSCPSSTFSTYSNLNKHMISKHGAQDDRQGYEAGSSEDEKNNSDNKSDGETPPKLSLLPSSESIQQFAQNADLPFKCHLCDHSFAERQDCLDHIRDIHASEYDLLMSKKALDPHATTPDEGNHNEDDDNEVIRGKFPDYSNRKVICAFCMRRFWSAEDLRRHMRTHTGERPFSCDICRRRFTLKHSMLRHRKKHNLESEHENNQSDEDYEKKPAVASEAAACATIRRDSEKEKDDSDANEGSDLISNLLGIRDRSLIEQVLTGSADDAAKLLGVGNQE